MDVNGKLLQSIDLLMTATLPPQAARGQLSFRRRKKRRSSCGPAHEAGRKSQGFL
jgi:hypothetical protein